MMMEINTNDREALNQNITHVIKELGDPLSDLYIVL